MRRPVTIALLYALGLFGCTTYDAYRQPLIVDHSVDYEAAQTDDSIRQVVKKQMWENYQNPNFYLATIEFGERGHLFHTKETYELLDRIKNLASDKGATIVVFIHGWHHNGSFEDENQAAFRMVLARLARLQDETFEFGMKRFRKAWGQDLTSRPPLIGISLAWRGESSRNSILTWLSFYDRKIVAHRVGGTAFVRDRLVGIRPSEDARKVIARLDADYQQLNDERKFTSLTLVGHSFGAALLYSATEGTLKRELLRQNIAQVNSLHQLEPTLRSKGIPLIRGVGDAIILVDPAFEARRYRIFGKLTEGGYTFDPAQTPKLIVFSSDGDSANRLAFPIGRYLSNLTWIPSWFQWQQRTTALGFYRADQTHWLHLNCGPKYDCGPSPDNWKFNEEDAAHLERVMNAPPDFDVSRDTDYGRFQFDLKDQRKTLAHSPFIVARTSRKLVPRHSSIFTDSFDNFLAKFIAELEVRNTMARIKASEARKPTSAP
jgi:pimeloyl-ACP methyl ester carboxylesterase